MPNPPDDALWQDVIRQVQEAIESLDLGDAALDDTLLDSVRAALDATVEGLPPGLTDDGRPSVVVLDGGRESSDRRRPDLRVAGPDDVPADGTRVRLVRVAPRSTGPKGIEGTIAVGPDQWQTVFRGDHARGYRVACVDGLLDVATDGAIVDRVHPGCTIDVEACLIRVRGGAATDSRGRYARL